MGNCYRLLSCSPLGVNPFAAGTPRFFCRPGSSASLGIARSSQIRWSLLIVAASVPGTEAAKPFQFVCVGPENPGSAGFGRLPPHHPTAITPAPQRIDRHPQFSSQVAQSPFMAPEVVFFDPPSSCPSPTVPGEPRIDQIECPCEPGGASRGTKPFMVEPLGDRGGRGAAPPQFGCTIAKSVNNC